MFKLLLKIAFQNLWRWKVRTIMVITMIAVGIALLIFMSGFYDGWTAQMVNDMIYSDTGELTVYAKGYRLSGQLSDSIADPQRVMTLIRGEKNIIAVYPRLKIDGMISSARYSQGVQIVGIDAAAEKHATTLSRYIIKGAYGFNPGKKEILVGANLADDLKVKLGSKIVIMGQAKDKSIVSAAYRVTGIIRANNMALDKYAVFLPLSETQKLFQQEGTISQVSALVKDKQALSASRAMLQKKLGVRYEVFTWQELYRGLEWMQKMMVNYNAISYTIVFLIVAIGVFNVVLISILERVREFGIMLAVGTSFAQVAQIIIWESICIGGIAFVIGSALGYGLLLYFHAVGLNFAMFAEGLQAFGLAAVITPQVSPSYFMYSAVAVFVTSFFAALWPIRILKKLQPVQTIRFI